MTIHKPLTLVILDGFGYRADKKDNAIAQANTPFFDRVMANYPWTLIGGSGHAVGLPTGQMGNSEVGHLNIGAGRVVQQDFTRIDAEIDSGAFFKNPVLLSAVGKAVLQNKSVHIMGLLSPGGVHSHEKQIQAMIELAASAGATKIYLHAFLDGRDTPPQSALASLQAMDVLFKKLSCGKIASMIGRYYAMDRDNRWERVQAAYELLTEGHAVRSAETAEEGLALAYANNENDEFVKATSLHAKTEKPTIIEDGDVVIFMNYRADRARQLTHAFTDESFTRFTRNTKPKLAEYVMLTEYDATFHLPAAYQPLSLHNVFSEVIANAGLHQLHIAETEKYAHVTFFFNGGREAPFENEDRVLIPSPKVATYDLQPEMSAPLLTETLITAIQSKKYDVIICNYANPDMVGHTGNISATIKAIEVIDACLTKIDAALQVIGGELLITADHGNAEKMYDEATGQPHTAHTSDPVPFIYIGRPATITHTDGALYDIAPTMLYLMGMPKPVEMTGRPLVKIT